MCDMTPDFWIGAAGNWRIPEGSKLLGRDCIRNPIGNRNATSRALAHKFPDPHYGRASGCCAIAAHATAWRNLEAAIAQAQAGIAQHRADLRRMAG